MIKLKSEEIGDTNVEGFNACLKSLRDRQGGGLEYYQVHGSMIVEYSTIENKLYKSIEMHGYRPHSLTAMQYLTPEEESDVYREVALGLADICIVSSISHKTERIWHGIYNMEVVK